MVGARWASGQATRGDPRWGAVCVPEGERFALWDRLSGACAQVDGPRRVWSMGALVRPLAKYTASPSQYLKIHLRDGRVEYVRGPAHLWEDPLRHDKVEVMHSLQVASNEAIVVYREESEPNGKREIIRSILNGPLLYVPQGLEWLHTFSWHGTDKETLRKPVQRKLPGLLCFQRLRLSPDQIYFDTPDVRTRDDARLTVKVMVFLRLADVERMLDATHDPISEFVNALSADVIDFAGGRTFDQFKADLEALNTLAVYPNLRGRAEAIGFDIAKVVFRGYLGSDKLQEMHDEAIQKRTELRLQKETQEQEQDLRDFQIERNSARAERLADYRLKRAQERQAMERESKEHQEAMLDVEAEANMKRDRLAHVWSLAKEDENHQQRLRLEKERNRSNEAHYQALGSLGVDLSRYLSVVARGRAHRLIAVEASGSGGGGAAPTQLHIHSEEAPRGDEVGTSAI